MGVEDDQAALLDGLGDVVHGGVGHGVTHAGAAGGAVEVLPHGLIVGGIAGEGGVGVGGAGLPVGLDQADLGGVGAAAAGGSVGLDHSLSLRLDPCDLSGAGIVHGVVELGLHSRVVAAGHAGGGLPDQEVAVLLQTVGDVGGGALDGVHNVRDQLDIVRFGQTALAAHGAGRFRLDGGDHGEHVVVQDFIGIGVQGSVHVSFAGSSGAGGKAGGHNAQHQDQDQHESKEAFELLFHLIVVSFSQYIPV